MRTKTVLVGLAVAVLASSGLAASTASATPATGDPTTVTAGPPGDLASHTGPFVSTLEPVRARSDGIALKTKEDTVVRNFFLTYPAGSGSGWHSHPGLVIATVVSGEVVRHLPCRPAETFSTGEAFVEAGPHLVENVGSTPATLIITQVVRADAQPPYRDDQPVPTCRHHH